MRKNSFILFIMVFFLSTCFFCCVKEPNVLPNSSFTYTSSAECSTPFTVSFQNLSKDATVYHWDFGDGSSSSHHENPIHIYSEEGVYTVRLTAYGAGGTDESKALVYVVSKPAASFSVSDTIAAVGDSIYFESTVQSTLPVTYHWSFGDGYTSHLPNPAHAYTYPGTYTVVLTVTNACGSTYVIKEDYIQISQTGVRPTPQFTASQTTINTGGAIDFTDLSLNNPQQWQWTFEGGIPVTSAVQHPSNITYATAGVYYVSLTVSNAYGDSTLTKTGYINVVPSGSAPVADFSASATNITAGASINFTDLSINNPSSWEWQFQGGTPAVSTAQNPTNIVYNTPGTYNVSLTVTNTHGSDTEVKQSYITVTPSTITSAQIKRITIEDMPFPTSHPLFRNPYYLITTATNSVLRDGRADYISGVTAQTLPVWWDLVPYFNVSNLNTQFKVRIFDWRWNPSSDIFVGEVIFNLANYTSPPNAYPQKIILQQGGMWIELDLEWQ